jgi:Insertion element 4 transposase N-terminal/Transposase DDE domain
MGRKSSRLVEGHRLCEHVTLGVVARVVPVDLVDAVLRDTGRWNWRARQLLPRLVVYYVMALTLYAHASYDAVLRELVEGLRWLRWDGAAVGLACKSAITQARVRLGEAPLRELFRRVARPLAEPGTPGAWYRELRLVSFDGTTIDVPDLPALERDFGRPSSPRGVSGFPQLRLLALLETGTHAIFAAALAGVATGEITLARRIVAHLTPGMLCLADRAFVGYPLWREAAATGADLLWRARHIAVFPCLRRLDDGSFLSRLYPSSDHRQRDRDGLTVRVIEYRMPGVPGGDRIYRLVTTLLDDWAAPAAELAALYHERWEDETVLAEVKGTMPGGRPILRSRRPDLIRQKVYGLLLTHFAIRQLMVEASQRAGCDPDTLSFVQTIEIIRRNLPFYVAFSP